MPQSIPVSYLPSLCSATSVQRNLCTLKPLQSTVTPTFPPKPCEHKQVVNVWTHPDHRRRGLARQLVSAALAEAEARGICTVSLGATEISRLTYDKDSD